MKRSTLWLAGLGVSFALTAVVKGQTLLVPNSPADDSLTNPMRRLANQIESALNEPVYNRLDSNERFTVALVAMQAAIMLETGKCASDSYRAAGAGDASILFEANRPSMGSIFALPSARKSDLVDQGLKLETHLQLNGAAESFCNGKLARGDAIESLSERQAVAHQAILSALTPATPPVLMPN